VSDGTTSCTQTRQVHYVDGDGPRPPEPCPAANFGGASVWALGYDDDAFWAGLEPRRLVRARRPLSPASRRRQIR
jgi:hypothetical protein